MDPIALWIFLKFRSRWDQKDDIPNPEFRLCEKVHCPVALRSFVSTPAWFWPGMPTYMNLMYRKFYLMFITNKKVVIFKTT
jgi:hypothetical protein